MFDDLELDATTLYAGVLAGFAGLLSFWMTNRVETISSVWAVGSGLMTAVISFVLISFLWSR